jgi:two-component system, sensor histidine kinase YesM
MMTENEKFREGRSAMFRHSIRNKLIFFLLAATIVPMAVSLVFTYQYTKESVASQSVAANSRLLLQGKTNIVNYLNAVSQSSAAFYKNNNLFVTLNYPGLQTDETIWASRPDIVTALQSLYHSQQDVYQIYFYMEASKRPFVFINELLQDQTEWNSDYHPKLDGPELWVEPPHQSHSYGMSYKYYVPRKEVLTFHRVLFNYINGQRLGMLSLDIGTDMLRSICDQLYSSGEENLFILDENGTVVYSPNREQMGQPIKEKWAEHLKGLKPDSGSFQWKDSQFSGITIYDRVNEPYLKWTIVKQVRNEFLYKSARELTTINTIVVILFLIVVVAGTVYISIRFTQPIKKLIGHINAIETGNLNVKIDAEGTDELGILSRRFRLMMETINNLILREYRLELANKTNELKALQAQTNPHFMNNALQSIGTLALQKGSPEIYSLISSLGKMMRYSMNTGDAVVPLASEIEYVKAYLDLQEQRFGEQLKIRFDLEPDVMQALLPKMTLQPIVENYFKHGFHGVSASKELVIACTAASEGRLRIEVQDNGSGIPPDKLDTLRQQLSRPHPANAGSNENIGLMNVHSRLQLFYNEVAKLKLEPVEPHGLRVILDIPLMKEAAEDESAHRG